MKFRPKHWLIVAPVVLLLCVAIQTIANRLFYIQHAKEYYVRAFLRDRDSLDTLQKMMAADQQISLLTPVQINGFRQKQFNLAGVWLTADGHEVEMATVLKSTQLSEKRLRAYKEILERLHVTTAIRNDGSISIIPERVGKDWLDGLGWLRGSEVLFKPAASYSYLYYPQLKDSGTSLSSLGNSWYLEYSP